MVGQLERKITMLHTVHLYVSLQITRLDFAANYPLSSNKIFPSHILRNMWPHILHESFEPCPNKGKGDWRSLAQFHPVNIQRKYAEMVWTCFKHSQHIPQTKSRWSQSSMPSNLQCHGLWYLCEEHKRTHISMTDSFSTLHAQALKRTSMVMDRDSCPDSAEAAWGQETWWPNSCSSGRQHELLSSLPRSAIASIAVKPSFATAHAEKHVGILLLRKNITLFARFSVVRLLTCRCTEPILYFHVFPFWLSPRHSSGRETWRRWRERESIKLIRDNQGYMMLPGCFSLYNPPN